MIRLQQRGDDPGPFFLERIVCWRLAGATVPVTRVSEIPFLSMKVSVDP